MNSYRGMVNAVVLLALATVTILWEAPVMPPMNGLTTEELAPVEHHSLVLLLTSLYCMARLGVAGYRLATMARRRT